MLNPDTARGRFPAGASRWLALVALLALPVLSGCGDREEAATSATTNPTPGGAALPTPSAEPLPLALSSPADQAWTAFQETFSNPPAPPAAWATQPPDEAEMTKFQKARGESAAKVADAAKDFYTRFPEDPRAKSAQWQELQLLDAAFRLGHTNIFERLLGLEKARVDDPSATDDERLTVKMAAAQRGAEMLLSEGEDKARDALLKSAQELVTQFPHRLEPYQLVLNLASEAPPEKARDLVAPLLSTNAPDEIRASAKALLNKLDMVGKPLDLKFTAVDGRQVDVAGMRGKVVLIDFWATWCGPCVAALPNVKASYERLHPKGFEIVGISFDEKKDALTSFVEREKMAWPQYFDGKRWENELGQRFGIDSIPSMWLVDKLGVVRDLNGREDLVAKVEKMLAETDPPPAPPKP